jgi:multidrug efflux pump subunit AcrB
LTSATLRQSELYDAASTVLSQKLSQIDGIGEVTVGGGSLPAVRVELNPSALYKYGIGLEDVRAALASANAHSPKGAIETGDRHYQIYDNDQANTAAEYRSLIVAYRNGAAVRLTDVGNVVDSVENLRNAGLANGKLSVLVILFRQPGANIIQTVNSVKALLPKLTGTLPPSVHVSILADRTETIRASVSDVQFTLILTIALVVTVIFLFLRSLTATIIPSVTVPLALVATFALMYLAGFSIDNLSLMGLSIAVGFVVDDAIVMLENIQRHIEEGLTPVQAALKGAGEIGFTIISISLSLVAVFIPLLLMGGIVGRIFREFAITVTMTIAVSAFVALTLTPVMAARFLKDKSSVRHGRIYMASERVFELMLAGYRRSLDSAIRHRRITLAIFLATVALSGYLFVVIPKGFFPTQDTGFIIATSEASQDISFAEMSRRQVALGQVVSSDPDVAGTVMVVGATGNQTRTTDACSLL